MLSPGSHLPYSTNCRNYQKADLKVCEAKSKNCDLERKELVEIHKNNVDKMQSEVNDGAKKFTKCSDRLEQSLESLKSQEVDKKRIVELEDARQDSEQKISNLKTHLESQTSKSVQVTEQLKSAQLNQKPQALKKLYIFGGRTGAGGNSFSKKVNIFDFKTQSWSLGHEMSFTYDEHSAVRIKDLVYLLRGHGSKEISLYNTQANVWSTVGQMKVARE